MSFPDSFATARLRAERLVAGHCDAIRAMDGDARYMALLGGIRNEAETRAYLAKNLKHWDDFGFGLWMLRGWSMSGTWRMMESRIFCTGQYDASFPQLWKRPPEGVRSQR